MYKKSISGQHFLPRKTYFSTCRLSFVYSPLLSGSDIAKSLSSQLNRKAVIRGSVELRAIKLGLAKALYSDILVDDSLNGSPERDDFNYQTVNYIFC